MDIEVPPGKYPVAIIGRVVEQVLQEMDPEQLDWSAWVEQINDTTLRVHATAVN